MLGPAACRPSRAACRPPLPLLLLLLAAARGLRERAEASHRLEHSGKGTFRDVSKYKVGQFMQYQILEGPQMGQWAKCSITGFGDVPDTYNIYVWGADPSSRNFKNIPEELLRTQAEQDAKQRAIDAARAKAKRIKEEAEKRERELILARQKAMREATRRARAEAEALRAAREAEAARVREEEERGRAERERLRLEREANERKEAALKRKLQMRAKWQEVKAIRAKQAAEAKAKMDEAKAKQEELERRRREELQARIARGEVVTTPQPPKQRPALADPENIKVTLKMDGRPALMLKAKRNLRLRSLMGVAAEKMGKDPTEVRFTVGSRIYSPEETAESFGPHDRVTVHVVPVAPREAASLRLVSSRVGVAGFEVGDFVLVNSSDASGRIHSVPCTIRAKGSLPDTYDIHFVFASGSVQDVANVPGRWLREVGGKHYAELVKEFRQWPSRAFPTVAQVARAVSALSPRKREMPAPPGLMEEPAEEPAKDTPAAEVFEVDNLVQYSLPDGSVAPFTVTAANGDHYDLHALFAPAAELRSLRDLHNAPAQKLKRLRAGAYVQAVRQLKEDPAKAQRVLELAARELGGL